MKTRTLLPLGTRWDGSAARLPEKAARRSAASRGQGSLPPAPAGHIPPRCRAIVAGGRWAPAQGSRRSTAAAAALATGSAAAAMRTLRLPGAAACLLGVRAAGAAARHRSAGAARRRDVGRPPRRSPAAGRAQEESLRWSGAGRGAGGTAAPRRQPEPQRRPAPRRAAVRSGRRVSRVPSLPTRVCDVQSRDVSGKADGTFPLPSVSQPQDRIFIGKLLPAHPLGSEEFRALLVFCSLIACTGVPPAPIQKRDALAAFFFFFVISYLFIGINEKPRFEE